MTDVEPKRPTLTLDCARRGQPDYPVGEPIVYFACGCKVDQVEAAAARSWHAVCPICGGPSGDGR